MTSDEKYRMLLVESIKVGAQMLYEMAYDIAGKTDHISDLSVTITFDRDMNSLPELIVTRSHLPNKEQIEYLIKKEELLKNKEKGLTSDD